MPRSSFEYGYPPAHGATALKVSGSQAGEAIGVHPLFERTARSTLFFLDNQLFSLLRCSRTLPKVSSN